MNNFTFRRKKANKKRSRQTAGVPSSALDEALSIFGDVEDALIKFNDKQNRRYNDLGEKTLEDQFEPSILSEKYLTQKDCKIRDADVPERIQV